MNDVTLYKDEQTAQKDALAEAVLLEAPFEGWSKTAMDKAAKRLGVDPDEASVLFPKGALDALIHFNDLADRRMVALSPADGGSLEAHLALMLKNRLQPWADHKEAIRRSIVFLTTPPNISYGPRIVGKTMDTAWKAADGPGGIVGLVKKGVLATIYHSLTVYWLADESDDGADSWAFLERRIAEIGKLKKLRTKLDPKNSLLYRMLVPTAKGRPRR